MKPPQYEAPPLKTARDGHFRDPPPSPLPEPLRAASRRQAASPCQFQVKSLPHWHLVSYDRLRLASGNDPVNRSLSPGVCPVSRYPLRLDRGDRRRDVLRQERGAGASGAARGDRQEARSSLQVASGRALRRVVYG